MKKTLEKEGLSGKTVPWKRLMVTVLRFVTPIFVLLVVWELLSAFHVMNPVLLPRPSVIIHDLYEILTTASMGQTSSKVAHSILLTHILTSLYRLICSFSIGICAGIPMGILIGRNRYARNYFEPLISLIMPVPGIAWAPIFMLWLGFGDLTIITVGALVSFFPIVYNTAAGVRSVDKYLVWASWTMGATKRTIFFKVLIPSAAAYIFTGLKLGLARGWRTIIAVEMIAGSIWGLGFMIFDAREFLQTTYIYGGIMVLALIFFLIENTGIRWLEKKTIGKWGMITEAVTR